MEVKIVLFLVSVIVGKSAAQLRCYACSFSSSDSDKSCMTITEETNIVECPFTYCTIFRQEYVDPKGVVASFTRGCEKAPDFLNHQISDPTFMTYYRACTNNLCNIGNGIESVTGSALSATPLYTGLNLLVPGTRMISGASHITLSMFLIFITIAMALL